ncbi:MAG: endonuclease/exonuclease/phosphatase family protein [Acidimicrobiia bacterium]|nr:endonuclease/exonuclease/phosphatase family protein [Acidimicrobiia bacterium]
MNETTEHRRLARLVLSALVFVLGYQSMRFLFASLTWYLRDTLGIGVINLIPISLAPFILGALVPIVSRFVGVKPALWSSAVVLMAARLVIQVSGAPSVDYWAASIATLAFVGSLPLLMCLGREAWAGGLILGLVLDSAIKGLGLSLDLAYQPGWRSVVAVGAISGAVAWALPRVGRVDRRGPGFRGGLQMLGVAPYLFLQLLIFQPQGWSSAVTGIPGEFTQFFIAILNVGALVLASRFRGGRLAFLTSLAIVAAAAIAAEAAGAGFGVLLALAIPLSGIVLAGMIPEPETEALGASGVLLVLASVVFLVFGLAYYLPLDLSLGFDQSSVRLASAAFLVVFGLIGLRRMPLQPILGGSDWMFGAAAAVLPAAALVIAIGADTAPAPDPDAPIRFMSYNVHSAFNVEGNLDVEGIARVIEDSRADVVGLQEVPRGRLLSGTTDLLTLLEQRLGFEHIAFFGTTDPVWGNAILSRYPIVEIGTDYLPLVGTPMRRGFLGATIDIGGEEVLVISTHLQHVNDSDVHDEDPEGDLYPVHREQIATILANWGGVSPAVLMGDFNARPEWAQIGLILESGWVDSWAEAGTGDGFTSNAADPRFRIDYVFHTQDLAAVDAGVIQSTASDHFPVVVDLTFE